MRIYLMIAAVLTGLLGSFSALSADLQLKNGQVYRNYRIKSLNENRAVVVYTLPDGAPDAVEISVDDLPDNVRSALGISGEGSSLSKKNITPEEILIQTALALKNNLIPLTENDVAGKQILVNETTGRLQKELEPFISDAEFETVKNGSPLIAVRVLKVNRSTVLKTGEPIFIHSSSQLGNRFRAQVYSTGCKMAWNGKILRVFALDKKTAVKIAMENILSSPGIKEQIYNDKAKNINGNKTETAPKTVPQVVNNYYVDDDDDDTPVYVVRGRRRYVNQRPPRPPRPAVPENRPTGRPEKPNSPEQKPSSQDKFSKNKSIVQRDNNKIHSYEHLPAWAQPRYSKP